MDGRVEGFGRLFLGRGGGEGAGRLGRREGGGMREGGWVGG